MTPLIDMLMQANNGRMVQEMAERFGLSQQKTLEAIEALAPAFSTGLKRNASNAFDLGNFLQALASGQHARYFEDMGKAFAPDGTAEGNGILGHLFGSKEVSRAVAAQAAQATGVGQDILKQMLPVLASAIMGGLFKQSTGQMGAAQAGAMGANPIGELIEQMMRQGMGQQPRAPQPSRPQPQEQPDPFDNPFGKILKDMFGGGAATQGRGAPPADDTYDPDAGRAPQRGSSPFGDNPLGQIFEDMMRGGFGQGGQRPAQPAPQPRQGDRMPSGRQRNPYDDLFGQMFETGRQTQDTYQRGIESIFEQFTKGMDRRR